MFELLFVGANNGNKSAHRPFTHRCCVALADRIDDNVNETATEIRRDLFLETAQDLLDQRAFDRAWAEKSTEFCQDTENKSA